MMLKLPFRETGGPIVVRCRSMLALSVTIAALASSALAQSNPFTPMVRSEFEADAFRDIQDEADMAARLDLTESFLVRYPESELRPVVLRARWNAFASMGDFAAVIGIAETALEAETAFLEGRLASLPDAETLPGFTEAELQYQRIKVSYYESLTEAHNGLGNYRDAARFAELGLESASDLRARSNPAPAPDSPEYAEAAARHRAIEGFFFRNLMVAHGGLRNTDEVIDYGRRALQLLPDDLFTLIAMSTTIAESLPSDDASRADRRTEAEGYAAQALETLDSIVSGPEGSVLPPGQEAVLRSRIRNALGLIDFDRGRFADAQAEYLAALDSNGRDSTTYYRLGVAYANDRKGAEAIQALARAVFLGYPGTEARDGLIRVYEQVHGDLEGMEELIDAVGQSLPGN